MIINRNLKQPKIWVIKGDERQDKINTVKKVIHVFGAQGYDNFYCF